MRKGVSPKPAETTTEEDVRSYILKRKNEGENYSVEHLRRALNIGYKKAKRIFDEMEGRMAKAATGPSTDDDYNGKAAPTPKKKRGRKSAAAANGEAVQPPQPKAAAASADASSASAEAADDGVKTRSSRRIKRDLGRWTEGSELHRDYEKIIEKLMAHPNAWPFTQPVDPVALNIPDYLDVVKQPMDLGTVQKNLAEGEYEDSEEVLTDVAQVWANCLLYNPPEHPISQWAHELSAYTTKLVDENEKKRKSEEESDLKRKAFVYPSPISKKDVQAKRKKLEDMSDGSYPEHQTQEEKWVEKYEQLKDFRDRFGHCRVPKMWDENLALGTWVHAMRQYKRKGKLSEERTQKLEDLDFTWRIHSGGDDELELDEVTEPISGNGKVTPTRPKATRKKSIEAEIDDGVWAERYQDLEKYWKRFGHSKVPKKWDEDPGLGTWVAQMRERKRAGKLDEGKVAKLDKLGFTWNFQTQWEKTWEDRFEQLKQYKETHGTCLIAKTDPANKTLYQWVHDVRGNRRRGKLAAERIRRLDKLGFVWNPSNPNAPSTPAASANYLPVKRKRGRPRKADIEAALEEANLWGIRIVDEPEETETDSDTETAGEEDEDDDQEGEAFEQFAEDDEAEEADVEADAEESVEAGGEEGGEEDERHHQQQNGVGTSGHEEPEEQEQEEQELTGDEAGGGEEAGDEGMIMEQETTTTTTTTTTSSTTDGDETAMETDENEAAKNDEEVEDDNGQEEEEEEEEHKTEPEDGDTMAEDETEGEAGEQEENSATPSSSLLGEQESVNEPEDAQDDEEGGGEDNEEDEEGEEDEEEDEGEEE